jgi:hypothetical protein
MLPDHLAHQCRDNRGNANPSPALLRVFDQFADDERTQDAEQVHACLPVRYAIPRVRRVRLALASACDRRQWLIRQRILKRGGHVLRIQPLTKSRKVKSSYPPPCFMGVQGVYPLGRAFRLLGVIVTGPELLAAARQRMLFARPEATPGIRVN